LPDAELERAQAKWTAKPETAPFARHAEIILAKRHRDVGKLKALGRAYAGHHYLGIPELRTWDQAQKECEALGGHLLTIANAEEDEVAQAVAKLCRYESWLGLRNTRVAAGGSEKVVPSWITGEPVKYTAFKDEDEAAREGAGRIGESGPKWGIEGQERLARSRFHYIIEWDE